jgi:hypothetical protein
VADTGNATLRTVTTNNDPTTLEPGAARPGSGASCSFISTHSPLAGIADWSVIAMTVGLIGAHRRVRWLFQLLSALLSPRRRTAIA